MIKTFKFKGVEIDVATNYLKNNECYFPTNPEEILEQACKLCVNRMSQSSTDETLLMDIYNELKHRKIAPKELRFKQLKHTGSALTDIDAATKEKVETKNANEDT